MYFFCRCLALDSPVIWFFRLKCRVTLLANPLPLLCTWSRQLEVATGYLAWGSVEV